MGDTEFHEVERGSNFAIYQGPMCVVREDWSGPAIRFTYVGYITAQAAPAYVQRMTSIARTQSRILLFQDFWEATGYDSAWRVECTKWGKDNAAKVAETHILSRSKILNMGVSVVALALPGVVIKSYGKRADFDILAKKAGLPLNPSIPALAAPKQL
jgi:hypothetical protein